MVYVYRRRVAATGRGCDKVGLAPRARIGLMHQHRLAGARGCRFFKVDRQRDRHGEVRAARAKVDSRMQRDEWIGERGRQRAGTLQSPDTDRQRFGERAGRNVEGNAIERAQLTTCGSDQFNVSACSTLKSVGFRTQLPASNVFCVNVNSSVPFSPDKPW